MQPQILPNKKPIVFRLSWDGDNAKLAAHTDHTDTMFTGKLGVWNGVTLHEPGLEDGDALTTKNIINTYNALKDYPDDNGHYHMFMHKKALKDLVERHNSSWLDKMCPATAKGKGSMGFSGFGSGTQKIELNTEVKI